MKTLPPQRQIVRQALVATLSVSLAFGPVTQPAYAALTALADIPIAAKVTTHPNIIYTVDDSGSMTLNYLPEFVNATGSNFYRNSNGNGAAVNPFSAGVSPSYSSSSSAWDNPPFLASSFNTLAYNPNVTYQPPLKADGTPLTYNVGTVTDASGNQINLTKVQTDPYLSASSTTDLSGTVQVTLYCNSDWPLDTSIGTNGEYQAGKGADCRINGTAYDAAANGAPAVVGDYNYPWAPAVTPGNAQYFFNQSNKQLWCNTASPGWPTTLSSCNPTCPAPQTVVTTNTTYAQTWVKTGDTTGCLSGTTVTTWTPAGCNTDTASLYCSSGDYGTGAPPECTMCTKSSSCTNGVTGENGTCGYIDPVTGLRVVTGNKSCSGAGCVATCSSTTITKTTCSGGGAVTNTCTSAPANSANCDDPLNGLAAGATTTLLDDAELVNGGTGTTCRHNNKTYATGPAAGPVVYGSGSSPYFNKFAPYTKKVSNNCPNIPSNVNIPRNYYAVDSVSFCTAQNPTSPKNNVQWQGFGLSGCTTKNPQTSPIYVKYGQFHRTDLVNDGRTYPYTDLVSGTASSRTYAQEAINYGNWYAYYRTRILAAKTTSSIAFSFLDNSYRVGFHTLGSTTSATVAWVNPLDFNLAQKTTWYSALYNIFSGGAGTMGYKTPSLDALLRVGNLFEKGSGNPGGGVVALPATAVDPISSSCQNNYHIFFTDGTTNQATLPAVAGNKDSVLPTFPTQTPPDQVLPNLGAAGAAGTAWPAPFREGGVMADTLSDIATYYWSRDLRASLIDNVPAQPGKQPADYCPAGATCPPTALVHPLAGDLDWTKDVAWWQHVNFSAISFGTDGVLDSSSSTAIKNTVTAIKGGTQSWPVASPPNNPTAAGVAIDDLWHATVNARGAFVNAHSPIEVSYGIASILSGIANQRKSRIGAAFSGTVLNSTNNVIYEATIEPGWAGDLLKVQIDPLTAKEVATLWQASSTLTAQLAPPLPPATPNPEPWNNDANQLNGRRVVTINDSSGAAIPFRYASLSTAQLATLSSTALTQQKMVAYLRGGSTYSGAPIEGTGIGQFRQRFGPLGDITNAQPVIVTKPTDPPLFEEGTNPGYANFVSTQSSRPTRVFAASNDGMVHSFDDADGHEVFAFIPKALLRSSVDASGRPTGLQALTYQDGGVPIYKHHFYADSSPRTSDVNFGGGSSDWHTIVVGGLGKGGNSYYALDATDANAANETQAAAKVLWEFHDADMVYTYGRPIIGKTSAYGWVVVVTAGYNNVSGVGKIYFLNPKTGALLKTMSTGFGTPANPAGLAQINGFTKYAPNQLIDQIYGGDLYGNFWRFDISDANPANWTVVKFATLVDPSGVVQPVTTAPQIEIDFTNSIDRYVFIGTGQLLDETDLTTPSPAQRQTLYAFRDGTLSAPMTTGLPISTARASTALKSVNVDLISSISGGAPNGWYQDLPLGERIVVDVEADVNVVAYIGTQPPSDPCVIFLPATLYAREYTTGRSLLTSGGPTNVVGSLPVAGGAVGIQVVGLTDAAGNITLGGLFGGEVPGTSPISFLNPAVPAPNHFSWRLLGGL
jgi:type IV pilus assembly protein PilY1